ncbi:hypothetical protein J7L01_01055 [bacterium]|nr:hypothetical protein [bacterium]
MDEIAILDRIFEELDFLKKKILSIEKHMVDIDSILTEDDFAALAEYRAEKAEGSLTSQNEVKAELGL